MLRAPLGERRGPAALPATQYVSFDVFDTLIKRSVAQPCDVFVLMEASGEVPVGFARERAEAEHAARACIGKPPTIAQIYALLQEAHGDVAARWMDVELKLELDGCVPNPTCVELLRRCVEAGRTVVLISDMYLSAAFIARMLEKCGIRGYGKLYVSCEWGVSKRDGGLFRQVLTDLGIRPGQMTHIGDNRRGDVRVPLSVGIRARYVPNGRRRLCTIPAFVSADSALAYRTLRAAAENCTRGMGEAERQGCICFGPLLLGFTLWLAERLRQDGIRDVYFMARDGYIMKQAFDSLRVPEIRTHYLYCSRRAYIVPLLYKHSEFEDTLRYLRHKRSLTFRNYLGHLGLEAEQYRAQAEHFGLDIDKKYRNNTFFDCKEQVKIKAFYASIRADVVKNAEGEYKAIMAYLAAQDMPSKIGVVDIGYYGTMQHALTRLLEESGRRAEVKGYYVAVKPHAPLVIEDGTPMDGYLYSATRNLQYSHLTSDCVPIFENQFLLAPHGSVRRFVMHGNDAEPEFCAQEFTPDSLLKDYQRGALKLIEHVLKHLPLTALHVEPDAAFCEFVRFTQKPTLREAKLWGDLGFHDMDEVIFCARPKRLTRYLLHPGQFKRDFFKCMWKIGFMKRLFRLPLPYDRTYHALQNWFNKTV